MPDTKAFSNRYPKNVIVIAGPTAAGKTACAIAVAKHFNTEIISADSRQCYRELNIGVARPSTEQLTEVKHHFIASHSIHDDITAAYYERYALNILQQLFINHDVVVVCGGTGLYIKALLEGLDEIPEIDLAVREQIQSNYQEYGINWLQQQLQQADPLFASEGEMLNPQRMMRALEVATATGKSILSFRSQEKAVRPFNILYIALELPRDVLYERINSRVDEMLVNGLLEEAVTLWPFRELNALQTVGYKELFDYLDGNISLDKAVDSIKKNTRRYAKRQMTWFRKQPHVHWVNVLQIDKAITIANDFLAKA